MRLNLHMIKTILTFILYSISVHFIKQLTRCNSETLEAGKIKEQDQVISEKDNSPQTS